MIGGFIITGSVPKKVAIRGVGPSLANAGLSDVLADPTLELRGSNGALVRQNDNWQDDSAQAGELTNLGLALADPRESGIVATLNPGAYTAIIAGKNLTSGIALVEIYDADPPATSRLGNISTRGFVQTGQNVMIGGFILGNGSGSATVAVRGIGPSLGQLGLSNVLADPTLQLRDGNGALVIANDNWQDDSAMAAQLSTHGLALANALESGIYTTLPPGLFTSILAGQNGGIGLGLVEIYGGIDDSTLIVANTADSGAGSLRDALARARDGDTIQFAAALNGQTITLASAGLVIDKDITISGPGRDALAVSKATFGQPQFSIFHILPGHTVVIEGLTISHGYTFSGGGIFNEQATVTLRNCTVCCNYGSGLGGGGFGGGIYNYGNNATMTIVDSLVTGNFMAPPGLPGLGFGGAGVYSTGTLAINNSIITGNFIGNHPSFPDPPALGGDGAGIYNAGLLTMSNSIVSDNRANRQGGGIYNFGTMEITASTISGNHAQSYGGGGVFNQGTAAISNSTVDRNTVGYKGIAAGGGIFNTKEGSLTVVHSTFDGNNADGAGGGIYNTGTLQIGDSIVNAGTQGASIVSEFGTFTSLGYNLSSDNGGGFLTATGDQINTNPMLGPLQDNGGPTFTLALLPGSPAINAGDPNFTPPPLHDQRGPGYDRVVGGRIDIGSFEVQP